MEAFSHSHNHQHQQHVNHNQHTHQASYPVLATQTGNAGHTPPMQASPATILTLKARILAIAQFVNAELSKLENNK